MFGALAAAAAIALPALAEDAMAPAADVDTVSVEMVVEGSGVSPEKGNLVRCHYVLTLNGFEGTPGAKVVDSSRARGKPFSYNYGVGQVVPGWDQAMAQLRVGGRARVVIPPSFGYGSRDVGGGLIPANSNLYFDMELLNLNG
jgi:peptidylprolyl isomerase